MLAFTVCSNSGTGTQARSTRGLSQAYRSAVRVLPPYRLQLTDHHQSGSVALNLPEGQVPWRMSLLAYAAAAPDQIRTVVQLNCAGERMGAQPVRMQLDLCTRPHGGRWRWTSALQSRR
jgi:hypothetical protein